MQSVYAKNTANTVKKRVMKLIQWVFVSFEHADIQLSRIITACLEKKHIKNTHGYLHRLI